MTPSVSLLEIWWLTAYITAGKKNKSLKEKYLFKNKLGWKHWDRGEKVEFITTTVFVEKAKCRWEE